MRPKGLLHFPAGITTVQKSKSAGCVLVDICLLQTQRGAFRDALKMLLRKFPWIGEVSSLCFFLPCAKFWSSSTKSGQYPLIILSQNPKYVPFNFKNGRERKIQGKQIHFQEQTNVENYTCPGGTGRDFRLRD